MKTTKDGKVAVTVDVDFTYIGKIDKKAEHIYQKVIMAMHSKLTEKTNGELIDQYNKWFSENVCSGSMDDQMLALYDAGLSARMMEAASDIRCMGMRFIAIDCHTATYTAISDGTGKGVQMHLGAMKLD